MRMLGIYQEMQSSNHLHRIVVRIAIDGDCTALGFGIAPLVESWNFVIHFEELACI